MTTRIRRGKSKYDRLLQHWWQDLRSRYCRYCGKRNRCNARCRHPRRCRKCGMRHYDMYRMWFSKIGVQELGSFYGTSVVESLDIYKPPELG